MTALEQAAPIFAAIQDGFLYGQHRAGEPCPQLPNVIRMVGIDDRLGRGPLAFDANELFDQVDSVIVDCQGNNKAVATPALLADKARSGDRTVLIQTTADAGTAWLRFIAARPHLAKNFSVIGIDYGKPN